MNRESLEKAFRAAIYYIKNSGIYINLDKNNPEVDAILEDYGVDCWAYITAWNPEGKQQSREKNLEAQIQLLLEIKEYILLEGANKDEKEDWYEETFLVLGMSKEEARSYGKKYHQAAFLFGQRGGVAELVFVEG